MPSSVASIFAAAGCSPQGWVRWSERIPCTKPGVYAVALTADLTSLAAARRVAPISISAVQRLLERRTELLLDEGRPTAAELTMRLSKFWLPDEVVLYIGLAGTSLQNRVRQYYTTPLGAAKPHSGGWFLKTLDVLSALHVHFAPHEDPKGAEHRMLEAFTGSVSESSRAQLHDPDLPFPFANIEWPKGRCKNHGITGARGP